MQQYRAYIFDAKGQVKEYIEFHAPDDQAALAHARQYVDHHDAEVWVTRVVARLVPTSH
jgi:hypothetical protein